MERNIDRIGNDTYALAIVSYALQLANSAKKDVVFKTLEAQAVDKGRKKATNVIYILKTLNKIYVRFLDGTRHWTKPVVSDEKEPSYWNRPRPVDVEMTSYALQTYLLRNDLARALPIIRWLTSQQNANGGFSSTQVYKSNRVSR